MWVVRRWLSSLVSSEGLGPWAFLAPTEKERTRWCEITCCISRSNFQLRSTERTDNSLLTAFATRSERDPESLKEADSTLLARSGALSLGSITLSSSGSNTISLRLKSLTPFYTSKFSGVNLPGYMNRRAISVNVELPQEKSALRKERYEQPKQTRASTKLTLDLHLIEMQWTRELRLQYAYDSGLHAVRTYKSKITLILFSHLYLSAEMINKIERYY